MMEQIMASIIAKLLADDVQAWMPRLATSIVNSAVQRLPACQRERFAEEWLSDLESQPGNLARLINAIDLYRAATAMFRAKYPSMTERRAARIKEKILPKIERFLMDIHPFNLTESIVNDVQKASIAILEKNGSDWPKLKIADCLFVHLKSPIFPAQIPKIADQMFEEMVCTARRNVASRGPRSFIDKATNFIATLRYL